MKNQNKNDKFEDPPEIHIAMQRNATDTSQQHQSSYREQMEELEQYLEQEDKGAVGKIRKHCKFLMMIACTIACAVLIFVFGLIIGRKVLADNNNNDNNAITQSPIKETLSTELPSLAPQFIQSESPQSTHSLTASPSNIPQNFPSDSPQSKSHSNPPQKLLTESPSNSPKQTTNTPSDLAQSVTPSNTPQALLRTNLPSDSPQELITVSTSPSQSTQSVSPSHSSQTNLPSNTPQRLITVSPSNSPQSQSHSQSPSESPNSQSQSQSPSDTPSNNPQSSSPTPCQPLLTQSPSNPNVHQTINPYYNIKQFP